jgi:hypothetical protein
VDRTPDGIAFKFTEKARISPDNLRQFMTTREGAVFTPAGVLRLALSEDEQDNVLDVARAVLLQLRAND